MHITRWHRHGSFDLPARKNARKPKGPCKAPGCDKTANRIGMCDSHRARWYRHGSYDLPPSPKKFDSAPLMELVSARGGPYRVCVKDTRLWWMLLSAQYRGTVNFSQADELAIGLFGAHPAEIWHDAWWDVA